jgi:Ca2+-binding EF-hand superfamily protein
VEVNDPILIRHLGTNHYLASDFNKIKNEFGVENEVFVHSFASKNRSQNLALEKEGKITGDLATKFQEDQNVFYFLSAPSAAYSQPVEILNKFTIDDLIKEIKAKIVERSASVGIRGMTRIFKAMDNNKNGLLDVDDFRWGLMDYGISLSKEEAVQVLKHFDRDGNGQVDFNEFIRTIRGDLKASRKAIIREAYEKLDVNGDGTVKLDDIAKRYDASQHPDITQGRKTLE